MILRIAGSNKYNNFTHNRQVGGNGRWRTRLVLEVAGQGCRRRPAHGCLAASAGDENVGTLVEWAAGAPAAARGIHGSGAPGGPAGFKHGHGSDATPSSMERQSNVGGHQ